MSEALKNIGAITLFVENLPATRSFYERVFARTAALEDDSSAAFRFDNTLVNLVTTQTAGEVIAPVAVASPTAGSRFLLTIWVDDVDAEWGCSTARWTGRGACGPRASPILAGTSGNSPRTWTSPRVRKSQLHVWPSPRAASSR